MRNRLLAVLAALAVLPLAACGTSEPEPTARTPGFKAGERLMIFMSRTSVAFDGCTNASQFTEGTDGLAAQMSPSFVAYEVSDDGTEADLLRCTSTGVLSSCSVRSPRVILPIEEGELVSRFEQRLQTGGCTQIHANTVRTRDQGTTFVETFDQLITLEGDAEECEILESSYQEVGTNGFGIDGCIVRYTTQGELR